MPIWFLLFLLVDWWGKSDCTPGLKFCLVEVWRIGHEFFQWPCSPQEKQKLLSILWTTLKKVPTLGATSVSCRESISSLLKLNWSLFLLNLKSYVLYFSLFETRSVTSRVIFDMKEANRLSMYVCKFTRDCCRSVSDKVCLATRSNSQLVGLLCCSFRLLVREAGLELFLEIEACISLLPLCAKPELLEVVSFRFRFLSP